MVALDMSLLQCAPLVCVRLCQRQGKGEIRVITEMNVFVCLCFVHARPRFWNILFLCMNWGFLSWCGELEGVEPRCSQMFLEELQPSHGKSPAVGSARPGLSPLPVFPGEALSQSHQETAIKSLVFSSLVRDDHSNFLHTFRRGWF